MTQEAQSVVLVVEDEPLVQMLIADLLGELGYSTVLASDAQSALASLETEREIDLLLTDIGLPGADGWALAESARKLRPSLPVLFATGYGDDPRQNLAPGMAMIAKPFETQRLASAVRALLDRASPA
jgi:CheY-like chemotaxis protein